MIDFRGFDFATGSTAMLVLTSLSATAEMVLSRLSSVGC